MARQWPADTLPSVIDTWARQLRGYPVKTIMRAAQSVIDNGGAYPPGLPEFKAVCRQFVVQKERPLLEQRGSEEVAQAAIAKAKQTVRDEGPHALQECEQLDGALGRVQGIYLSEMGKRPNRQWACRLLWDFVSGRHMRAMQTMMACNALGLSQDEMSELSQIRNEAMS